MSTKKDKFLPKDKDYMRLAINLARAKNGLTGDNPAVGCVLVKNNTIISIGQTGINGRPHAEINALKNAFSDLVGAKMYVSLEPCNHYGKTPPCTKSIIKSGISEVFYAIDDLDKKVKGKSSKILSKHKIKVKKGLLINDARDLYKSYKVNRIYKLPYVVGKIAISKNNLIYSPGNKKITDKVSDKLTHFLRYKNDGIMISSKTLNIDNPRLSCRLKGYEKFSPKRIILDKYLEIKLNSRIFKSSKKGNTIIFHSSSNILKSKILRKKGIILIKSKLNKEKNFDLKSIFKKLYILGINNLLVEGGDKVIKDLLKKRLINQFYLFKSPKNLPDNKKKQIFTSANILSKYSNSAIISSKLAKDTITIYKY
ncbi:bifunctional diaminohydroxyphosphoribosylaminopyrimidine deaminase/5-amino-6-(5-phosphoribosylamino)uracil reductase RibD [Candidatus Pelagibacter sp.]|nr:bifunctional diaminohydroxyphosphoribosylaminopyrimidine deaminase/5-amino-6-(5-phosphoribosylamino)uracil reductase RibD [Candidatus Pelagibacter sp.]